MLYWYARSAGKLAMGGQRSEIWGDGAHYVPLGPSWPPDRIDATRLWEKGKRSDVQLDEHLESPAYP